MTAKKKRRADGDDGDGGGPKKNADGSARKQFDESLWLRDGNGRFAGSVKQSSPFTDQQRIELKDYKEGNYRQLNSYLANPTSVEASLAKELNKQVKTIDAAILKSTLVQDTIVYRGIQSPALARNIDRLIGKTMNPPNYLSTSTSSRVARDFAGFGSNGVVLAIKAKTGMRAAHLDQFQVAGNAGENELLFPRDSKIRLTGVDRTRSPMVIMGEFE